MSPDILLVGINARYHHSSFGLRYLFANMQDLQDRTKIIEFVIGKNAVDMAEEILRYRPRIVGVGVYIWNTTEVFELISILKLLQPELKIILGGPEISYETTDQPHYQIADFIIPGEADLLFYQLCHQLLNNPSKQIEKLFKGPLPDLKIMKLPYSFYSDEDIQHRIIYVEASRGCPFKCEYCLSSLDTSVRNFDIELFLHEMESLMHRGARQFKFVDRTFNLSPSISTAILHFFYQRVQLGLFLHFEMVPDRLPNELKQIIEMFPPGSLQFEIGIQTWNPTVAELISRRQKYTLISENLKYLREKTKVHTHVDLIVGLPSESIESFAHGFDQLYQLEPDEIQVGILKRLKGTPIIRHNQEHAMIYSSVPPFQLLQNKYLSFNEMQKFQHFSRFWDHYMNSGNFLSAKKYFEKMSKEQFNDSMFALFWNFTDFLLSQFNQSHAIALTRLKQALKEYLKIDEVELPLVNATSLKRQQKRIQHGH